MSQKGFPVRRQGIMFEMSGATGTRSGCWLRMAASIRAREVMLSMRGVLSLRP
jgi:hypothetical protein